ncbi:hypothetical protein BRADI_2g59685v3 [Brachypodium distachyon]|uniref:RING-type E3 ubiquitin transferase n=1 Tax=Brachypodium distachyon TaxID=15368 RepID=A0A0Q3J090_BRADI|nr:hypothetical protein BRADI_2g59685v3 [Brachypodium distachyon]
MAQPERDSPYTVHADPKMTQFETRDAATADPMDPPPWPRELLLVARIGCAVRVICEFRFTDGSVERHEHRRAPAAAGEEEEVIVGFAAEDLRSESACRAVVRWGLVRQVPRLKERYGKFAAELWDAFVPPGLVHGILAAGADAGVDALRSGSSSSSRRRVVCDVVMRVHVTNVYCEAKALLLSCADDAGRGAGERCPICMEELGDGTSLPGCSHAFHKRCILEWFHTAPNCPCCRRDMIQYLPHKYRR